MLEGLAEIRQGNLLIVPGMCQLPAANDWLGQSYQYWAPLVFQSPFCKVNPSLPLPTGQHCCPRAARLLSTVHHNPLAPGSTKGFQITEQKHHLSTAYAWARGPPLCVVKQLCWPSSRKLQQLQSYNLTP